MARSRSPSAPVHVPIAKVTAADSYAERYRVLIEQAADDFFMHDDQGNFLDVNEHACASTGYTREELLDMHVFDIAMVPADFARDIWAKTEPGFSSLNRTEHRRKDGSIYLVEMRISCEIVEGRKLFFGLGRDITEQVAAEERIQELNAQLERRVIETTKRWQQSSSILQAVMDAAPDLVFVKDRDGRYIFVNKAAAMVKGMPASEVIGKDDTSFFGPDLAREVMAADRTVMDSGQPREIEEHLIVDGEIRTYLSQTAPYYDGDDTIGGIMGISRDVTAARRAEQELQRSEARWQFAIDRPGDGIWDWDIQTGEIYYSEHWKRMLGYAADEIGPSFDEWIEQMDPKHQDPVRDAMMAHLRDEIPEFSHEYRIHTKTGEVRWIHGRGRVIERDEDGRALRMVGTQTDITERRASEAAFRKISQRLQLANRVSGLGVWECPDVHDDRLDWDEQMYPIYGLRPEEYDGSVHQWLARLHPDDLPRVRRERQARLVDLTAPTFETEYRIRRPDGAIRHIRSQAQIFRDERGDAVSMLGVNWDITTEKNSAETLRRAKEDAEAAEKAKSEFLAMMSHEIRTPMNGVIGMTRLALQTDLPPKARDYLRKVDRSAQNLITIINDILDFSKIEAGKVELEEVEFALDSVLESVSAATAVKAEQKGLEVGYSIGEDVPDRLVGDPLRLGQVLINLVGNAIKFTETGSVIVGITVAGDRSDRAVTLSIAVRDTGIGLDDAQMAKLFQAFSQADSGVTRHYGGTGLGLAICKQIVELMHGTIGVRSAVGQGSTFEFTADLGLPEIVAGEPKARSPQLAGKRVLVTDDSEAAREILVPILRGFGMDVASADSGQTALRLLNDADHRNQPYDLVLMDWQMPGMDGLEAAQVIRETPSLHHIPAVLMVTAYSREEVVNRADQLGLQGVLVKPVTQSMMYDTVASLLAPDVTNATIKPDTEPGLPARHSYPTLAGRRALVVDDNIFNREVAAGFLEEVGVESDCAVDGTDALRWLDRGGHYDVVLMDVQMPGMDGYETAREVRKRPDWADVPIIALTAHARAEDRQRSADAGMDGHLTKPIDDQALYTMLTEMLREAPPVRTDPPVAPPAPPPATTTSTTEPPEPPPAEHLGHVDLVAALNHVGGRQELLTRLVGSFVQDFETTPDQVAEQFSLGHAAEVAGFAHAVRGAASYLHADALCAVASELEDTVRSSGIEAAGLLVDAFVGHLKLVLGELSETREAPSAASAASAATAPTAVVDTAELLRLVDSADPLVETGDYSAQSILTEIETLTAGTHLASSATRIRQLFDQLDLDEAHLALRSFRAAAGADPGSNA